MEVKYSILYIVSTLKRAGPLFVLLNIVKYLDKTKYKPIIVTLSPEIRNNSLKDKFEEIGINIKSLNLSRLKSFFYSKSKINIIFSDYRPAIIHTHGIRADYLVTKYFKNYNHVSTLHNYPFYDYPMKYGKLKGFLMAKYHLNIFKKINYPIACSKFISNIMFENHNLRINYIHNGVETKIYFKKSLNEKKKLREKLNLPMNKKIFISVGHLSPGKDTFTVINGFINSNVSQNSVLIFIGDGVDRQKCMIYSEKYSNIKILGRVPNVEEYLNASDYFISASLAEGLPNSVLEAMACGLPVILSNIPSHLEIVENISQKDLTFSQGNVIQLSKNINLIYKEDYDSLSNESVNTVKKIFSASIMSNKYQELYRKIINNLFSLLSAY